MSEILTLFIALQTSGADSARFAVMLWKRAFEDCFEKKSAAGVAATGCSTSVHPMVFWGR